MCRSALGHYLPGLLCLTLTAAAAAQETLANRPAAPSGATDAIIADLEARRAAAESDTALPDATRRRVLELFARAIEARRLGATATAETAVLETSIATAPKRLVELERQLEAPPPRVELTAYTALPMAELTRLVRQKQLELTAAREALKHWEEELASLTALGQSLSGDLSSRKTALRELTDSTGTTPPPDELPAATAAREAYLSARQQRLRAQIALAELYLANYELLVRLARLERDVAASLVPRRETEQEALVTAAEARRAEDVRAAREAAQATEAATLSLPAGAAQFAADNTQLREELERVTLENAKISKGMRAAERRLSELDTDLIAIQKRVKVVGSTEAIGRLLRRRLRLLPGGRGEVVLARELADEIIRATDRRIDLGEQRRDIADPQAKAGAVLAALPEAERATLPDAQLRSETVDLIGRKRDTLDDLHEAYGRYLTQLTSYDATQRQLAETAGTMREFILRKLLWIRSLPPLSPSDLAAAPHALSGLASLDRWRGALSDARRFALQQPGAAALGLLAALTLLGTRPWSRRRLSALAKSTASIRTDAFRHTVFAVLLTMLIAAIWPTAIGYAGWMLGAAEDAGLFSRSLSDALLGVAHLLAIFSVLRWAFDSDGLALRHFRWSRQVAKALGRELSWLVPVTLVCVFLARYVRFEDTLEGQLAVRRPALMVFSAALAVFVWRFYGRGSALMEFLRTRAAKGLSARAWRVWFPTLLALPLMTLAMAVAGYGYTATVVAVLLINTGTLLFAVIVLRAVILRWFTVTERRLRFEQALQQREEARLERERLDQEGGKAEVQEVAEIEEPDVDYRELGEQARSIVQAAVALGFLFGLWWLWSDLLPALSALDEIQLPISRVNLIDGVEQQTAITLTDVAVAVFVLAATGFLARNLSGLLGFTLLRRVVGDAGKQYAIVTLCQYALVGIGVLYAFSTIGVQWSKLQWLVAALGVGLGFGLQEIVANFVSGIILLIERPVRVGDTVTVGDSSGTVSRIQIRATTIVDWDRKELVVPNKEFVTGRLLNWSLSSDIVRLVIPVGIAYGSDVREARKLLLEAAKQCEHVLDDPDPIVVFNSFGDNALGLELRVYLPSIDYRLSVQTALHDAVYEKFEKAGIVISFPQRDVHIDWKGPLDVRLHRTPSKGEPAR